MKKKSLLTLFLVGLLLLVNSAVLLASDFSMGGNISFDRRHFEIDSYVNAPTVLYGDAFKYEDHDAEYTALILGVDYFFLPFSEHDGLYIGLGLPIIRDISNNNPDMKKDLGSAYESGIELRSGLRCSPFSNVPLYMGVEYSSIKKFSFNVGVYF